MKRFRFAAAVSRLATPLAVEKAMAEARKFAAPPTAYPMVVAPYLSEDRLTKLQEGQVSGLDLCGNVWQWTANVYEGQHYRYMRGGSKADYGFDLRVWTRNNARPDYYSPNVGFRCVRAAAVTWCSCSAQRSILRRMG